MRRVSVIGSSSGAGKTTLGRALAARLGVPFIELDALHWTEGGWVEPSAEDFRRRVARAIASDEWVVDGQYHGKLGSLVLARADTVVWLDLPLRVAFWRLLRRSVSSALRRETLWGGNRETLRGLFLSRESLLLFALRTYRGRRERLTARLGSPECAHLRVHRFGSTDAAWRWLMSIPVAPGGRGGPYPATSRRT